MVDTVSTVVIRPRIWEYRSNLLWLLGAMTSLVGVVQVVLAASLRPRTHQAVWPSFVGGGGVLGFCLAMMFLIPRLFGQVLIVTSDQVIVRSRFRSSQGERAAITSLQVRNRHVDLTGPDGPVVSLSAAWTMGKYERTAAWLGITVHDHRILPGRWRDPSAGG